MVLKNVIWDFGGRIFMQLFGFVIAVILARLLSPDEFGIIGIAMVVLALARVYIDLGFGASIIQSKRVGNQAMSSIFYINTSIGIVLTLLLFFLAEPLARFFERTILIDVFRAVSMIFFIGSLAIIQNILLHKNLQFKKLAIIDSLSYSVAGVTGILLALLGFGIWALVTQQILISLLKTILLWQQSKWLPMWRFKFSDLRKVWKFSSRSLLTQIIITISGKIQALMVVKLFSPAIFGYMGRAATITNLVVENTSIPIGRVLFPYISKHQDRPEFVLKIYYKTLSIIGFLSIGLSAILFSSSEEIFVFLFTAKWIKSSYFFVFLILADGLTKPVGGVMHSMLVGLGHAGTDLKIVVLKRTAWIIPLIILWKLGLFYFLVSSIVFSVFVLLVDMYAVRKHANTTILKQFKAFGVFLFLFIIAIIPSFYIPATNYLLLTIVLKSLIVLVIYLTGSYLLFPMPIHYLISKFKALLRTKNM